jgi:diguanylate cyclase (GGDEF)-like protein/PAS domain S-box-containing protein
MKQSAADVQLKSYRAVFESVSTPMLIFDADTGRCVDANAAADRAYGYHADEWRAVSLSDLYEVQDRAPSEALLRDLDNAPSQDLAAVRHRRRDGGAFWASVRLGAIMDGSRRRILMCADDATASQETLSELSLMREHCALAQEMTGVGHCVFDLKSGRQSWSARQYLNFGLAPDAMPADLAGGMQALLDCVPEPDRELAALALRACIDNGQSFDTEWRLRWPDGSEHVVRVDGMRKDDPDGTPRAIVLTSLDLTDRRRTEENLRQSRRDLSRAEQIARIGTWTLDFATQIASSTSDEMCEIFGLDGRGGFELPVEELNRRIHPDDLPMVEVARRYGFDHPGTGYYVQYRVIPRAGVVRHVESQAEVQTDADGKAVRMVGFMRDVTEARLAEQEIQRLAYHDELTGLPNRVALRCHLDHVTSFDAADCVPLALLIIDVSRFQDICLTLGPVNSDALLKDVALRITGALGEDIYVARTGGTQFAAILSDISTYESTPCAQKVLKAFEAPFPVADILYDISVHVGIALFPGHATDSIGLFRKGNVAACRARQLDAEVLVYHSDQDPYQPERLALLGEFRRAIHEGQIELYCQPKVALSTNEVTGAEALVRWRHPRLGMISPTLFVPLIEDTELIHVLTRHMLQAAVRQCFNWQRAGLSVPLAVNISPRNLLSRDLVQLLETLLHTWGGSPDWLGLEITESSLITDPEASIAELATLSDMGFRLFIDDFGTGYSSLGYLTRMPVDVIKIDHGFTMLMLEDQRAAAIVKSTIELAHNLGMSVVAEGTASQEIWNALVDYGCDEAQGFFLAEPFPACEFETWLHATGRRVQPHAAPARLNS